MATSKGQCPRGGLWYTCTEQSPTFFGCCTSNPCNGVGCPHDDLRAAGMGVGPGPDTEKYGFANDSSYWPNAFCANGKWWTCATNDTSTSFQGCCLSDPCGDNGGQCAAGNLFPAAFVSVSSTLAASSTTAPISTFTWSPSSSSTSTLSPGSTSTPALVSTVTTVIGGQTSATNAPVASSTSSTTPVTPIPSTPTANIPLIVGAAVGGAVGGLIVLLIAAFFIRRYLKNKKNDATGSPDSGQPYMVAGHDSTQKPYNDAAYYAGHSSSKFSGPRSPDLHSPAPPSYSSPNPNSSHRNTQMSEIDSSAVYELGGNLMDDGAGNTGRSTRTREGYGLGLGHVS